MKPSLPILRLSNRRHKIHGHQTLCIFEFIKICNFGDLHHMCDCRPVETHHIPGTPVIVDVVTHQDIKPEKLPYIPVDQRSVVSRFDCCGCTYGTRSSKNQMLIVPGRYDNIPSTSGNIASSSSNCMFERFFRTFPAVTVNADTLFPAPVYNPARC